jgi:transposase
MTVMSQPERQARAAEAKRRFLAGEKAVILADEYGVHPVTVYDWVKDGRKAKKNAPKQRTSMILRLLAMEQNLTADQISAKLGFSERYVEKYLTNLRYRGYLAARPTTYSLAEKGVNALGEI